MSDGQRPKEFSPFYIYLLTFYRSFDVALRTQRPYGLLGTQDVHPDFHRALLLLFSKSVFLIVYIDP